MNGNYIKIMSDGTQCFIKDTECFLSLYPDEPNVYVRPTVEQFVKLINLGMGDFRGEHRVGQYGMEDGHFTEESKIRGVPNGTRIWDLEWCEVREFYFVYSCESKRIDLTGAEI